MTTFWGQGKLSVAIGSGPSLDAGWIKDLATRISIRTWPEMEEIASSTIVDESISTSEMGAITIEPKAPLADRWYGLRLSGLSFWITAPTAHVASDGSYVARFRTGSEPKVASVTFAGGPEKHRLYIKLSEPILASAGPAQITHVQCAGAQVVCTDVDFVANRPTATLSFDCPTLSLFPDQISIDAGFVSATGAASAAVTIAKTHLSLSSCGQDCRAGLVP